MYADLREVFIEHYGSLFGFAYRMLGDTYDAEDIVQEAFIRLAQQGTRNEDPCVLRRWLFVVTRNLCISHYRASFYRRTMQLDEGVAVETSQLNPRAQAVRREQRDIIKRAVLDLPPSLREVIILREYEDLSYSEIAEVVGCSVGTVKSRIARAREVLRSALIMFLEVQ